jgi:hypothetical protein
MHKGPITEPDHLSLDYMGSSEFEWGAIPRARTAMRAQTLTLTIVTIRAFKTETTFHVVAPADQADSLKERFQAWFDGGLRGQENPYLDQVITQRGWRGEALPEKELERLPIAWWAIEEHVFFTQIEDVALMWLNAMNKDEVDHT